MNTSAVSFRLFGALFTLLFLASALMMSVAQAGMIGNAELAADAQLEQKRAQLSAFLSREDVRDRLAEQGVSAEMAQQRVAAMTDAEVIAMSERMDAMPAGSGVVGTVVFVFLVLLFTDIMGWTDIFPFTRPVQ